MVAAEFQSLAPQYTALLYTAPHSTLTHPPFALVFLPWVKAAPCFPNPTTTFMSTDSIPTSLTHSPPLASLAGTSSVNRRRMKLFAGGGGGPMPLRPHAPAATSSRRILLVHQVEASISRYMQFRVSRSDGFPTLTPLTLSHAFFFLTSCVGGCLDTICRFCAALSFTLSLPLFHCSPSRMRDPIVSSILLQICPLLHCSSRLFSSTA